MYTLRHSKYKNQNLLKNFKSEFQEWSRWVLANREETKKKYEF